MKTIGVVLSGCGYLDGAEIHESVLTLLALDRAGVNYQCLAPDIDQMHVVNHFTKQPTTETRNVLVESARIARSKIQPLSEAWISKLDGVIFPGGFGAAKNYCDYAVKGNNCSIHPDIESFILKCHEAKKPIGVICISPVVLARAFKGNNNHPKLTVGAQSSAAESVNHFGSHHEVCAVTDFVVDRANRIVSCPAYMYEARISEVAQGIEKLVQEIVLMTQQG